MRLRRLIDNPHGWEFVWSRGRIIFVAQCLSGGFALRFHWPKRWTA